MNKIIYNTEYYPFKNKLEHVFNIHELTSLNDNIEVFTREKDQSTNWHKIFYNWARTEEFTQLYNHFI